MPRAQGFHWAWIGVEKGMKATAGLKLSCKESATLEGQDYHALHAYSVQSYDFWLDIWEFLGIISSVPPGQKIIAPGATPEVPIWFPDALLNYAENLLHRTDDAVACTAGGESGVVRHYSYRQLRELVRQMACAMRRHGLQKGDRTRPRCLRSIAAVVNNTVTAIVICLAASSIGAIYSSTSTDMGAQGILDRYRQIRPKFVFAETEVAYAGKVIDLVPKMTLVIRELREHGLQHAVTLPSLVTGKQLAVPDSSLLAEFLSKDDGRALVFEQLAFSHPVFILYSSGTSGPPKCIVHSGGGLLLQNKKEMRLHAQADPGADAYFQYTTTGWMVWNYMLIGLATGNRLILYDGSPFHPDLRTYLKFINDQRVGIFGTSPRFLAEVHGQNINPRTRLTRVDAARCTYSALYAVELAPFEDLKRLLVTGAVLTSPMFVWTQRAFGARVHLMSVYGGTDICSAFVTACPSLPVYAGELQCKALGMKVEVFDPAGKNIEDTGTAGELVCTRPHPSIPVSFWADESGDKFRDTYYSMYPGAWRQGDFVVLNPRTRGIMILGRSDGVLNPSGVRFGSGEIYSVMERFSAAVDDALCVGQRRPQDAAERVLLFVKMRRGHALDARLAGAIKAAIRTALSARHVPAFVLPVDDIPYTVNMKRVEIAVKQIVSGSDLKLSGTVANPESLQLYYKYRDLPPNAPSRSKM
ncbi:acetoacetate-CoA ligase [Mycena pura]|uniref:Acetoacetate-CoA ligase n=1 Tax=Mycena pura TaxID=153505 RepID=A0AAD6UNY9_9AGAR|nr:acetoacetate-CoA ligase [Mycena pura]